MKKFQGVIPALITPLNADDSIRVDVLKELLESLIEKGADGFYIGGATGEGIALDGKVRRALASESIRSKVFHNSRRVILLLRFNVTVLFNELSAEKLNSSRSPNAESTSRSGALLNTRETSSFSSALSAIRSS